MEKILNIVSKNVEELKYDLIDLDSEHEKIDKGFGV